MKVRLVDDQLSDELEIDLILDETTEEALSLQCHRTKAQGSASEFGKRLSRVLSETLKVSLDSDLQLPTAPQQDYAMAIARTLGVSIPSEALRYRGSMSEFLARFDDQFKLRREARRNKTTVD